MAVRFTRFGLLGVVSALLLLAACGGDRPAPGRGEMDSGGESNAVHRHDRVGETCFICDETKRDPGRLWCKEHARYEDRCWLCQPQLEDTSRLYCEEHGLYEDECFLCHPEGGRAGEKGDSAANEGHQHDTPGETCFICDATKRDAGRLWCREHARYEDRCWLCQPQLEEKGRPYCEEHWLYEDECFLCHPELEKEKPEGKKTSKLDHPGDTSPGLFCKEHQVPEIECGICQPQRTAELEPGDELKVRFGSARSASKAGIETVVVQPATVQASVPAICEVSYNENALARITPLAAGIVRKVLVDVGENVKVGDVLVEVHSTEVASAKAAFVSAVVDLDLKEVACKREERLAKKKISSEKEVQEADAACKTAELTLSTTNQRLLNYGFTAEEVSAIEKDRDTSAVFFVRAPYDGTLVDRDVVVGEAVSPGESLFSLADLGSMWLSLSVPADRAGLIGKGLRVEAMIHGASDEVVHGEITWVNTSIDEKSRMLRVRAVVDNAERKLSAGMFGEALVFIADAENAVDVPRDAIQRFEKKPYVFVKLEDDLYSLRRVAMVERPSKDMVAVIEGLRANESIVATGSFTVMSEFLKSRLGAGCVDD